MSAAWCTSVFPMAVRSAPACAFGEACIAPAGHRLLAHLPWRPCAVTHPVFRAIIPAKMQTRCNRPACNQKIQIGDRIVCVGRSTWCHVRCGITMSLEREQVANLEYLRTQVDTYARDALMAQHMNQRLAGGSFTSIYNGVPGSGKSTALVCFVKLTSKNLNEVFVYNTETAE